MSFNLTIPKSIGGSPNHTSELSLTLDKGQILFILGANGTGKSSLMHRLFVAHHNNALRITAHRQTWFESNAPTLSGENRRSTERSVRGTDTNAEARWKDHHASVRSSIAFYDLIDSENVRARAITNAFDNGDLDLATMLSKKDSLIKILNGLLHLSHLPLEISIMPGAQIMASKSGSGPYSIVELSDGERNALLIAANVLTVKDDTLILIDEPERHLHRSIISLLLTNLFAQRPECSFIISTHDVMLPLDNPGARTLLLRRCIFANSSIVSWDADLVPSDTEIDDDLKKDILGARRKLLFVEGTEKSLDKSLYSLIFPNVSVIPKSSCRDVEHAVSGIRDADTLHWVSAFGIVDNDSRTAADIANLKGKGIYAISVFSVESIYYHPNIQRRIAERHSAVTGEDADTLLGNAKTAALAAIRPQIKHLSERVADKAVREEFLRHLPRREDIATADPINISINLAAFVGAEQRRLQDAIDTGDLSAIIERYPIRETSALSEIAMKLGFRNREQYEGAVKKLLMDDAEALDFVKTLFDTLATDIA
jgi:ABC-type lipoprotein export system ATPase subunit